MGFEVEKAFPYATRLLVVGKRDAGSDAPAKVQSSREQVKTCSLLLCHKNYIDDLTTPAFGRWWFFHTIFAVSRWWAVNRTGENRGS